MDKGQRGWWGGMPRGYRRSEQQRRVMSSRARVSRSGDLGVVAPRAARRSLDLRGSLPGARRRQTVDVAGKTKMRDGKRRSGWTRPTGCHALTGWRARTPFT